MKTAVEPKLLKKGNIIEIKKGMVVYHEVEGRFIYSNTPYSKEKNSTDIEVGRMYPIAGNLNKEIKSTVKSIVQEFDELGVKIENSKVEKFVKDQLPKETPKEVFDTKILIGKYVVETTTSKGGGTSMMNDHYPNGHSVTARKLNKNGKYDPKGLKIEFYQTGSFNAMITPEEIQAIGQMKESFK